MTRISCDWCNLDRTDTVKVMVRVVEGTKERPSVTGSKGEVSKTTKSNCLRAHRRKSNVRCDPNSSEVWVRL